MVEIKTHRDHPHSMDDRINKRLRPSNDTANADSVTTTGHSPTRAVTSVHHSRNQTYGEGHPGEGSITNKPRGVV